MLPGYFPEAISLFDSDVLGSSLGWRMSRMLSWMRSIRMSFVVSFVTPMMAMVVMPLMGVML
jgi:hypothetical protein